jgi:hypothetical protein
VQQAYRSGANDPQIQMAEDAAQALAAGQAVDTVLPPNRIDIAQSLAPFLIVYNSDGSPLASNAVLHDRIPELPSGVLDYTRQKGEDRITWQPEPGVRSAVIILPVSGSQSRFVLAGRSLREVDEREGSLTQMVAGGWFAAILGTLFLTLFLELLPFTRRVV